MWIKETHLRVAKSSAQRGLIKCVVVVHVSEENGLPLAKSDVGLELLQVRRVSLKDNATTVSQLASRMLELKCFVFIK